MMNIERLAITSEITELEQLIADIPPENVLELVSFKARLKKAREELRNLPDDCAETDDTARKVTLTFRGKPVHGKHGIDADFGSKVTGAFSAAYTAIAASSVDDLRDVGPLPDRGQNRLVITGTAIGPFGFEFELPQQEQTQLSTAAPAHDPMATFQSLLRVSAEGTDDDVTDAVEAAHPRAVKKVHEFLDLLVQQKAWCGLNVDNHTFRFSGHAQLQKACDRLMSENIQEHDVEMLGHFEGVLPASRAFEFRDSSQGRLIKGKIGLEIGEPEVLNHQYLHKSVAVTFHVIKVGKGQPKYILESLSKIHERTV